MKLAILGADDDAIELVKWAVEHGGHELTTAYDSHTYALKLAEFAPNIRLNNNWEELFLATVADAVIIGRGGKEAALDTNTDPAERRADQFRKLTQAAVPMIIVCPACEAIVGFEIEMIRGDTKGAIIPFVPGSSHSGAVLGTFTASAKSGIKVEQVFFEREQSNRSREAILVQLARDIAVLRQFIGDIQTVAASGTPLPVGRDPLGPKQKELPSLANLNVSFGGALGLTARWSVTAARDASVGRLTVITDQGKAVLTTSNGAWSCQFADQPPLIGSCCAVEAKQAFDRLNGAMTTEFFEDYWLPACRDQEAAEAVDRSLIRGRTIELFNEDHTEEQSFKGVMAMGGCLLLLAALAIVFLVVLVESLQLPIRSLLIWRLWPLYLLIPIVIFLLLQFLQLAVKREGK